MCLAVPGKVEEIIDDGMIKIGRINFGGIIKRVCLDYVPDIQVGEYTIVHAGFALQRIDEDSAQKTLAVFAEMGALDDEFATEDEALTRAASRPSSPCPDGSCQA